MLILVVFSIFGCAAPLVTVLGTDSATLLDYELNQAMKYVDHRTTIKRNLNQVWDAALDTSKEMQIEILEKKIDKEKKEGGIITGKTKQHRRIQIVVQAITPVTTNIGTIARNREIMNMPITPQDVDVPFATKIALGIRKRCKDIGFEAQATDTAHHREKIKADFNQVWGWALTTTEELKIEVLEKIVDEEKKGGIIIGKTNQHKEIQIILGAVSPYITDVAIEAWKKPSTNVLNKQNDIDRPFADAIASGIREKYQAQIQTQTESYLTNIKNCIIRTEPKENSKIITVLIKGTKLVKIGTSGDWFNIKLPSGKTGYINKAFVSTQIKPKKIQKTQYTPLEEIETLKITVSHGNIRSKPSTKSKIFFVVDLGTELGILEKQGNWYHVKYSDGREGWAHEALFGQVMKKTTKTASPEQREKIIKEITEPEPSIQDVSEPEPVVKDAIKSEPEKQIKTVKEESQKEIPAKQQDETKKLILLVSPTGSVDVFSKHSALSTKLGTLSSGKKVHYLDKRGNFYYIKTNGLKGYVYKDFCKEIK